MTWCSRKRSEILPSVSLSDCTKVKIKTSVITEIQGSWYRKVKSHECDPQTSFTQSLRKPTESLKTAGNLTKIMAPEGSKLWKNNLKNTEGRRLQKYAGITSGKSWIFEASYVHLNLFCQTSVWGRVNSFILRLVLQDIPSYYFSIKLLVKTCSEENGASYPALPWDRRLLGTRIWSDHWRDWLTKI